jgi:hypothetical protein
VYDWKLYTWPAILGKVDGLEMEGKAYSGTFESFYSPALRCVRVDQNGI